MRSLRSTRVVLAAMVAMAATACSDAPQQSQLSPQAPALASSRTATFEATVQRRTPLATDITRSIVVSDNGGTIEIPEAGLRVDVPSGALPKSAGTIRISVTAFAGSQLAYEFSPAGTQFVRPLRFQQDLNYVTLDPRMLSKSRPSISYFKSRSDLDETQGVAATYESLFSSFDLSGHTVKADVWHFSGYVVAWGRNGNNPE
jgi:hypothetical protein